MEKLAALTASGKWKRQHEVAMALGHAPPVAQALVRFLYCDERLGAQHLLDTLHEAAPFAWRTKRNARNLISVILLERYSPHTCRVCHGTAQITQGTRVVTCPACKGTGRSKPSVTRQADALGVSRAAWYKTWAPRAEDLNAWFDELEYDARRVVGKMLRDCN